MNQLRMPWPQDQNPDWLEGTINDVKAEREWALAHRNDEPMTSPHEWVSLLAEELGEAAANANFLHWCTPDKADAEQVRGVLGGLDAELIQVAQLAVSAVVWLRSRPFSDTEWDGATE